MRSSPPESEARDEQTPTRTAPGRAFLVGLTGGAAIAVAWTLLGALLGGPAAAVGVWILWLASPASAGVAAGTTARLLGASAGWSIGLAIVALSGTLLLGGMADYGTFVAAVTSGADPVGLLWRRFVVIAALSVFFGAALGLMFGRILRT